MLGGECRGLYMAVHLNDIMELGAVGDTTPSGASSGSCLYRDVGKRLLDITFVLASAPITIPLVLLIALALLLVDGNRPFYRQLRVGFGGRNFWLLKLRTMVPDADTRLNEVLKNDPQAQLEWDETQKLKNDPRITRFGHILRKTSLDELPQFWNVLVGDMSLIGPRPIMVNQKQLYPGTEYYLLRPGISGSWQVSDRNETSFVARAQFDEDYYRQLSLGIDLRLLLRTTVVVLRSTGH